MFIPPLGALAVDDDGFYVIVDRKKDMILSGGMNIASKEVEEIVASHDGVLEVAVTGEPDPTLRGARRGVGRQARRERCHRGRDRRARRLAGSVVQEAERREIRRVSPAFADGQGAEAGLAGRLRQVPYDPRRSRMNVADLVAIDIHTHAKIPVSGREDPLTKAQRLEASKMFKTDIDTAVSVEDVAAYYRERNMAAVVFGVDSESARARRRSRTRRSPRSRPRTPTC